MPFLVEAEFVQYNNSYLLGLDKVWLLLGVEDTVGLKQYKTKRQKNEENNRSNSYLGRCFTVFAMFSTPRRSQEFSRDHGDHFKSAGLKNLTNTNKR